jgi:hypothetical protein
MVNVDAIIAIGRIAWKHGVYENVQHEIDADGSHRIIIMVPKNLAEQEVVPQPVISPTYFREHPDLTWEDIKPPPRAPAKPKK